MRPNLPNRGMSLVEVLFSVALLALILVPMLRTMKDTEKTRTIARAQRAIDGLEDALAGETAAAAATYLRTAGSACSNAGFAGAISQTLPDGVQLVPVDVLPPGKLGNRIQGVINSRCLPQQTHRVGNVATAGGVYFCVELRAAAGSADPIAQQVASMAPLIGEFFMRFEDVRNGSAVPCNANAPTVPAFASAYYRFFWTDRNDSVGFRSGMVPLGRL